ncbi:enoyl-CoA hydratase [soil metagenome]
MSSVSDLVHLESRNAVAFLTMNRPEARNALSLELIAALRIMLNDLSTDPELKVVVLAGSGDRAFSAGADLNERLTFNPAQRTAHTATIDGLCAAIESFPTPVIAAIHGHALAGGAEIAVACDLRVMDEAGSIGFPEVSIGVFPGAGGVIRLPRIIGAGRARDLLMTGRTVGAGEALTIGLIDRIVPRELVMQTAVALAEEIASRAPLAVRALKSALVGTAGLPIDDARSIVSRLREPLDGSRDYAEGLRAFAERRTPNFTGE